MRKKLKGWIGSQVPIELQEDFERVTDATSEKFGRPISKSRMHRHIIKEYIKRFDKRS